MMWKFMLGLLSLVTIVQGKERMVLVDNGKTDYVIQADANDPVVQKAAAVINTFTKESTGVDFAIQAKVDDTHAIILERSPITNASPEDSYSIEAVGKNIYIKGSGRGVIFAAYRYVRDVIGGRKWYTGKESTDVPKCTALYVDADLKIFSKPNFRFREVYFPGMAYIIWKIDGGTGAIPSVKYCHHRFTLKIIRNITRCMMGSANRFSSVFPMKKFLLIQSLTLRKGCLKIQRLSIGP